MSVCLFKYKHVDQNTEEVQSPGNSIKLNEKQPGTLKNPSQIITSLVMSSLTGLKDQTRRHHVTTSLWFSYEETQTVLFVK